jgi:hypothetical protein
MHRWAVAQFPQLESTDARSLADVRGEADRRRGAVLRVDSGALWVRKKPAAVTVSS